MTTEQENLLRRHYADTRTDRLADALGVSYRTVCRWAANLGLKKHEDFRQGFGAINGSMERNWSHRPKGDGAKLSAEVTEYLRRHYATTDNRVLAAHFHVNDRTIRRWADRLALRKDNDWIKMHRAVRRGMTPEQRFQLVAVVQREYVTTDNDELARRLGISIVYVKLMARRLGLKKSREYRSEQLRRQWKNRKSQNSNDQT